MATITEGFSKIHGKLQEFAETRLTVEKLPKRYNSGTNQSSMTSIKYDHLQVIGKITGKFHQNPLKTVEGVARQDCLRTNGWTDETTKTDKGHNSAKKQSSVTSV